MTAGRLSVQSSHRNRGRPVASNALRRPGALKTFRQINAEVIRSFTTGDPARVLSVIADNLVEMNLVNLTTALHRLAKMTSTPHRRLLLQEDPVFERLLRSVSLALDALKPREVAAQSLSNVAWSMATLQLPRADLVSKIVTLAAGDVSSFQPFELANLLWACAKLGASDDRILLTIEPIFQEAETHVVSCTDPIPFRCLATMLWAFATAKRYHASFFGSVAEKLLSQVFAANCQEMANTAWALGKANFQHEQLCRKMAMRALSSLHTFKAQELSNMIWGFSCVDFFHKEFFAGVATTLKGMDLTTQHIANISAAYARAAPEHPVTRAAILNLLPLCCDRVQAFKPQEVSAVLLAVSKVFGNHNDNKPCSAAFLGTEASNLPALPEIVYRFFEVVAASVIPHLLYFSTHSLASLAKTLPVMHASGLQDLVSAVADEALKRLSRGSSHTDLHDCLCTLGMAERIPTLATRKGIQEGGHAVGLAFTPCQILDKKENSRRRRGRARGRARGEARFIIGGPFEMHDEEDACSVGMSASAATSTDLHLQSYYEASSWTQGVGVEWSPYCMLQASIDDPNLPLDACDGEIETQWPTPQASGAPSLLKRAQGMQSSAKVALACSSSSQNQALGRSMQTQSVDVSRQSDDLKWNCSVKNSFLHVEIGYDSNSSTDDRSSREGGASQRSSSVPSRPDNMELAEGWHRRCIDKSEELGSNHRYATNLACLNFAWGMPSKQGPQGP